MGQKHKKKMEVKIVKLSTDWQTSAQVCMNMAKSSLFGLDVNIYTFRIGVWGSSMPERAVMDVITRRSNFIPMLEKLIELGVATIPKLETRVSRWIGGSKNYEIWVSQIDCSKLFDPICIETETRNFSFLVGPDRFGLGIICEQSEVFQPPEWYETKSFGNEFNGGTEYHPVNCPANIPLPDGFKVEHHSPGPIDGWGYGFKGGSYVVYNAYMEKIAEKAIVVFQGGPMNSPDVQFVGGLLDGQKIAYYRDATAVDVFGEDGEFVGWFGEIYHAPMTARDTYEERVIPVKKGEVFDRVALRCKKITSHPEIVSIPIEGWKKFDYEKRKYI